MSETDFDRLVERRGTDSLKWSRFGNGVLPLWVADMDFPAPTPVIRALENRIRHPVFGYGIESQALKEAVCERMLKLYSWAVSPESVIFLPGLVCGLNLMCRAIGEPGDSVLVDTPVYPPFFSAPINQDRELIVHSQVPRRQDGRLHYELDVDGLAALINSRTRLFILCNPQNPTGRVYSPDELRALGEFCLQERITICADEAHSDLLLGESRHVPIASLDPEIERQCLTLLAPSKTFNIPGLGCSLGIVSDPKLRARIQKAALGIVPEVNVLGMEAAVAAYRECQDWLDDLLIYLRGNRDFLVEYLGRKVPQIQTTVPEATYLAWLDCRDAGLAEDPHQFFLERARVALNDGRHFGTAGRGFVRLNFGCPRATLQSALDRMADSVSEH